MYAILVDKENEVILCLVLPERRSRLTAAKARTTRELGKLDYIPSHYPDGEKWYISTTSPHWVLRKKPCRQYMKDGEFYRVYLVDDYEDSEVEKLIKSEQVIFP